MYEKRQILSGLWLTTVKEEGHSQSILMLLQLGEKEPRLMHTSASIQLHEALTKLAYEYWERRGRPFGTAEIDWTAAENTLVQPHRDSQKEFSLCSLQMGPDERQHR